MAKSRLQLGSLSDNFATANITQVIGYSELTCIAAPYFYETEAYSSGYKFHTVILIVSAVTTILTLIFTIYLTSLHLANWVKPQEQKQLVRVILFPTIFAIFDFFSLWFYRVSWILLPFPELYEVFALVAMFYVIVVWVTPTETDRERHFHDLQRLHRYGPKRGQPKHDMGSLRWFQVIWVLVFQILPVKLATNLLDWILSARWCPLTYQLSRTALALKILESVSTTLTVVSIIRFAQRCAPSLRALRTTKTRQKLISFKGIVAITLIQSPIFASLATYGVFVRTVLVATFDFTIGVPVLMTCCEMFVVSILFLWTFTAGPYLEQRKSGGREKGVGGALVDVLDVRDILGGCWYMVKILFTCGRTGGVDLDEDVEREVSKAGVGDKVTTSV